MAAKYHLQCPLCRHMIGIGRHLDEAGETVDLPAALPEQGDITVCGGCASLLMFQDNHTLVEMQQHHYDTVLAKAGMPTVARIMAMVRAIQEGKTKQ